MKRRGGTKLAGIDKINEAIESGMQIIVGIDYAKGESSNKQTDNTTDHFVSIVGKGNDEKGDYFTFFENAIGHRGKGTDTSVNRLYIQSDNTLKGTTSWGKNLKFTVTQVRPTKKKK